MVFDFLNRDKREKLTELNKPKIKHYFFTLRIDGIELTFLSKEKNQIDSKLRNIQDSYLKAIPYSMKVKEITNANYNTYSFDIEPNDKVIEIIIPNLREIKLIKTGELEI
jgi:predicted nucleotidyltransferase